MHILGADFCMLIHRSQGTHSTLMAATPRKWMKNVVFGLASRDSNIRQ